MIFGFGEFIKFLGYIESYARWSWKSVGWQGSGVSLEAERNKTSKS
jgi:hypothetical protein